MTTKTNDLDKLKAEILKLKDAPLVERFPDREGGLLIPNHNIAALQALAKSHDELIEAAKVGRDFLNEQARHCKHYPGNDLYHAYAGLALAIGHAEPQELLCDYGCPLCAEQKDAQL